jgi:hypothetical protein
MEKLLQLLQKILSFISIKGVSKSFMFGGMGFTFLDCTSYFDHLFGFCLLTIGINLILFTYFTLLFWDKLHHIRLNKNNITLFIILRVFILIILFLPVLNEMVSTDFLNLESPLYTKFIVEILIIIIVEIYIDICSDIHNSSK